MVGRSSRSPPMAGISSVYRGFLVIADGGAEVGRMRDSTKWRRWSPNAHGLGYTNNALVELSRRGVPVVLCGANHMPAAIVWPVDAHHVQTGRMNDQVAASLPLKKRLWAQLVRAKFWRRARRWRRSARRAAGFTCCRARCGRATPTMSRRRRRGAIGRCCSAPIFTATRTRRGSQWSVELRLRRAARRGGAGGDGGGAASELWADAFQPVQSDGAGR